MSHQELERHDGSVEPAPQELKDWTFGVADEGIPSGEQPESERSMDPAAHEPSEAVLEEWEFGITEERSERTDAADAGATNAGISSTLEARLAPVVGLLVVGSLLLAGGYILVMTV
jgi:hypothetical protein